MKRSLFIFAAIIATTMGEISDLYPEVRNNLTKVTWEHAVNNARLLTDTLKNDRIMMIEADVSMGTVGNGGPTIPIMAHPPNTTSDLSLEQFLIQITAHNANSANTKHKKGTKLDFKSIPAFENSLDILTKYYKPNVTLWLNADVLPGPGNPKTVPVDATRFLNGCYRFPNATLSLGWTTYFDNKTTIGKSYESSHIDAMAEVLKNARGANVTLPIRAAFAVNNATAFKKLLLSKNRTLTVWSAANDTVDPKKLQRFIKTVGLNVVYLDVPKNLSDQMNLGSGAQGVVINLFMLVSALFVAYCNH